MSEKQPLPPNPHHLPDTFSTALVQKFEDGEGLPLDHPIVQERERNRQAKIGQRQPPPSPDEKAPE
jgi:hypothetical protein